MSIINNENIGLKMNCDRLSAEISKLKMENHTVINLTSESQPFSLFCDYENTINELKKRIQMNENEYRREKLILTDRENILQCELRKKSYDCESRDRFNIIFIF